MSGLNRNAFNKINSLMKIFPAVIITGVRQCGKTHLSKLLRQDWAYFDLEDPHDFDRITLDPKFFFSQNPTNLIIDEAQRAPEIFNILRGVIDADRQTYGRFIITGSSSADLLSSISESLAGRVAVFELGTLKTNEIFRTNNSCIFELFEDRITARSLNKILGLKPSTSSSQIQQSLLKGGYPEAISSKKEQSFRLWMENYFKLYINRDIRFLFPKLDSIKYRRFVSMLAALSGQLINKAELARSLDVSESTAKDYLDIAHGTFVWRNIFSFEKDTTKSIVKMPRGGFRDMGLLNIMLSNLNLAELENHPIVGRIFETFATEEILKGLECSMATNWQYHYFRTKNGAEIDLILSGDFGIVPIEIKYGIKRNLRKLKSLNDFVQRHDIPFGILVNNGVEIEMVTEKIIQVPINYF
jgi:uncharacterized protein